MKIRKRKPRVGMERIRLVQSHMRNTHEKWRDLHSTAGLWTGGHPHRGSPCNGRIRQAPDMLVHSRLHYFLSRKAGCRPPLRPSTVQPNRPDDWIRLGGDILPVVKARTKSSAITTGRQAAADLARTVAGIAQFGTPQANRTPVPAVRGTAGQFGIVRPSSERQRGSSRRCSLNQIK